MSERARRNRAAQRRARAIRRAITTGVSLVIVLVVVVVALLVRGGDDETSGPALSDLAQQGKELAVRHGCVGCHGRSGEGGANHAGPAWASLYGTNVQLADGSTVVADRDYLIESIVDPRAKQVAGFNQKMPVEAIPEADVLAIVQYIQELATPATTSAP
ncbi:MAG: c-type cytochrome [Acidimicrobiales bacterium]